jgi:hypothetical protein
VSEDISVFFALGFSAGFAALPGPKILQVFGCMGWPAALISDIINLTTDENNICGGSLYGW